jgi:hypothetical protein
VTLDPLIPTTPPPATAGSVPPPTTSTPTAALPPVEPVKTATTNTGAGTKPTPPAPATGAKACDACIAAANAGNAAAAAGNFARCDDTQKKDQCRTMVRNKAPGAAQQAARLGQCQLATGILSAAQGMGASSPKLASALDGTSCK